MTHVCLTLDGWTSCQQYSYFGVTIHYFAADHTYKNRTLTVKHLIGNHTNNNILNAVIETIHFWKICTKLIAVVTDNAATIRSL